MIKVFSGTNTYESFLAALKEAKKISDSSIKYINGDEISSVGDILNLTEGIGLFQEKNTYFIKRLFYKASIEEEFIEQFEVLDKNDIVIWLDQNLDGKKKIAKFLKAEKRITIFEKQKPWQVEKWIETFLKNFSFNLNKEQIIFLLQISDSDKWIIRSELQKIEIFCKKNSLSKLSDEQFNELLGTEYSGNIWDFLDFFGNKKYKDAKEELEKLLRNSDLSQYIISMLNRELQLILDVQYIKKTNGDFKSLKLHPFVLQKTLRKAESFSSYETERLINSLLELDLSIKKGEIKSSLGLNLFLDGIEKKYYF